MPPLTAAPSPDAAPADRGVRADRRITLRVGPSSLAIQGARDSAGWPLDAVHRRFLRPSARPDLTLSVFYGPAEARRGKPVFQFGELACIHREGHSWVIRLAEDRPSAQADRMVTLDGKAGSLVMDTERFPQLAVAYPLEYPLEDLLFRHLLAERHALLVHACGVAWQGRGYLFVGSSGAGKSTIARLWKAAGASILNDDRVVLAASRDGIFIHPTPWSGDFSEVDGETVRLDAIYLLRQGSDVHFEALRPSTAGALLFAKSFAPLWDPARVARTLNLLDRVCRQVSCGWLTVPPDQRGVAWVQSHP